MEPGRYGASGSGGPGVALEEVLPRALVQLNGISNPDSLAGVLSRLGIAGTPKPRLGLAGESGDLLWTGADQWWVVEREREMSAADARELCAADDATALDLGHARTVVRVDGPMARDLLAKGCPLDVDGLEAGFCAPTRLGPFSVVLHCRTGAASTSTCSGASASRCGSGWRTRRRSSATKSVAAIDEVRRKLRGSRSMVESSWCATSRILTSI